jgi:hypothetical protein
VSEAAFCHKCWCLSAGISSATDSMTKSAPAARSERSEGIGVGDLFSVARYLLGLKWQTPSVDDPESESNSAVPYATIAPELNRSPLAGCFWLRTSDSFRRQVPHDIRYLLNQIQGQG